MARNHVLEEHALGLMMVVSAATLADIGVTALSLAAAVPTIAIAFAFSFAFCFASACFAAVFATSFSTSIFPIADWIPCVIAA